MHTLRVPFLVPQNNFFLILFVYIKMKLYFCDVFIH